MDHRSAKLLQYRLKTRLCHTSVNVQRQWQNSHLRSNKLPADGTSNGSTNTNVLIRLIRLLGRLCGGSSFTKLTSNWTAMTYIMALVPLAMSPTRLVLWNGRQCKCNGDSPMR